LLGPSGCWACGREERGLGPGGRGRGSWFAAAVGLRRPSGLDREEE